MTRLSFWGHERSRQNGCLCVGGFVHPANALGKFWHGRDRGSGARVACAHDDGSAPWQALVEHGCGWWVEPTPSGITGGLRLAISCTPPVLREMGRRGRALVASQFGWDAIAERFLVAYENKLPRKRFS